MLTLKETVKLWSQMSVLPKNIISLSRGSSPDLSLKLRFNYFCTYQFPPRKSTRNRQTSINPNVDKSLSTWHQSHPRALTLSLLERFPPPQWISEQFLRPIHGNPRYGHLWLLIFRLGLRSAHNHEICIDPRLTRAHNWSFSAPIFHVISWQRKHSGQIERGRGGWKGGINCRGWCIVLLDRPWYTCGHRKNGWEAGRFEGNKRYEIKQFLHSRQGWTYRFPPERHFIRN